MIVFRSEIEKQTMAAVAGAVRCTVDPETGSWTKVESAVQQALQPVLQALTVATQPELLQDNKWLRHHPELVHRAQNDPLVAVLLNLLRRSSWAGTSGEWQQFLDTLGPS